MLGACILCSAGPGSVHAKKQQLQDLSAPVPPIYRLDWTAKDLLILEQTINRTFVLVLQNASQRLTEEMPHMGCC